MRALAVAGLYLGSFLVIGFVAKALIRRWTRDTELPDIQAQAGPNRRKHKAFLLGSWRDEN
jgi:hypothetical protein